jgi:quinoprotein glucose dehydrogenase
MICLALLAMPVALQAQAIPGALPESIKALSQGEWPAYAGTYAASRYSPLTQIDRSNARDLHVAWRWKSPDHAIKDGNPKVGPTRANESTPLMVGGTLYTSTSLSQVAAIDAATGVTKWVFDPKIYENGLGLPANDGWLHRGVAYWRNGDDERIVMLTAFAQMIALDAKTGKPVPAFGTDGRVDLAQGLRRPVDRDYYTTSSPPVIVRGVIVVGSSVMDWWGHRPSPPGDVRGFDVVTGRLLWTFHTVAQQGEPGVETWEKDSWKEAGNANVWAPMSADEELGYVYLPVSTPTNDYYGGLRPGDGLFGDSLVCIDATSGRKVWHYQLVHHGLWDYDTPAAPNLIDVTVGGKPIKAVAQVTKQAFVYVFDRVTGKPVWPIEEQPVPASSVPGENASKTQPFPTKPAPIDIQGVRDDDLIDLTPEIHQEAIDIVAKYDHGPLFTPPSERGTIQVPGVAGGGNWAGAGDRSRNRHALCRDLPAAIRHFRSQAAVRRVDLRFHRRIPLFVGPTRDTAAQAAIRQHRRGRPEYRRASLADSDRPGRTDSADPATRGQGPARFPGSQLGAGDQDRHDRRAVRLFWYAAAGARRHAPDRRPQQF